MGVNRSEPLRDGSRCEGDHIPSHPAVQAINSHWHWLSMSVRWLLCSCKAARYESRRGFKTPAL